MDIKQSQNRQRVGKNRINTTNSRASADEPRQTKAEWLTIEEALRVTRVQLRQLLAQQFAVQENERRRIALELHDGLGQALSLAKLTLQDVENSVSAGDMAKTRIALQRTTSEIQSALDQMRRIAINLRPATLDDLGIVATMSWYFREVESAYPKMRVDCEVSAIEADVPDPLKITIFRIIQEATGNALKHADADRLNVSLTSAEGMLNLAVIDNGKGFDPKVAEAQRDFTHGIGLQSMKERAELSGGSYNFQSTPDQGTRISVKWPLRQTPECPIVPMNEAFARTICKAEQNSELPERSLSTDLRHLPVRNYCRTSCSSAHLGGLIQTATGGIAGCGACRTKRSGCAA